MQSSQKKREQILFLLCVCVCFYGYLAFNIELKLNSIAAQLWSARNLLLLPDCECKCGNGSKNVGTRCRWLIAATSCNSGQQPDSTIILAIPVIPMIPSDLCGNQRRSTRCCFFQIHKTRIRSIL